MANIRTLYGLAVYAVAKADNNYPTMKFLPENIKSDILRVASRLGHNTNLCNLFHGKVRCLDLNSCKITEEQIEKLCICSELQTLLMNPDWNEYYNHSNKVLDNLFRHLPMLIKLHIQRNDGLTDYTIYSLVQHCPLLIELDLSGCRNLTDKAIGSIAELKYLTSLCLSGTKVSDLGLIALSLGSSKCTLKELKLINCLDVSDSGINAVFQNFELTLLEFCGCPKVTSACQVLREHVPLKNLTYTVYWN